MAKERLVGSDGELVTVTFGTALVGDATDDLDDLVGGGVGSGEGWYRVAKISDGTSALPSGLVVGDLFWDDGTLVLADASSTDADEVEPLVTTQQCDVTSFSIDVSRNEIDVTTLCDNVMKYRGGKIDMTGSLEGITTLGVTDNAGWIMNNFIRVIKQASAGTVTVNAIDDDDIYIQGKLQKDTSSGESEAFIFAKITVLGTSLGASGDDAQSFSGNFRIAPGGAGDAEPTFYVREVA